MKMISGIEAAPSEVTITGAMPVTRIVPARPTTNAPHQFVPLVRPPSAYSSSSISRAPAAGEAGVRSSAMQPPSFRHEWPGGADLPLRAGNVKGPHGKPSWKGLTVEHPHTCGPPNVGRVHIAYTSS